MKHRPIVLRHLLGVPLAVGGAPVASRADLAEQPGHQELIAGIQPLRLELDTPACGQSLWYQRYEFGGGIKWFAMGRFRLFVRGTIVPRSSSGALSEVSWPRGGIVPSLSTLASTRIKCETRAVSQRES